MHEDVAHAAFDGANLNLIWVAPFAGILLSLALFPLLAPAFWHRRYGLVALGWALLFLLPFLYFFGAGVAVHEAAHAVFLEYIPFIVLIGALFTIAGGIYVGGDLHGGPRLNTSLLAAGMALASFAGTTGASMILIRPLIRANNDRRYNVHVVVFFIFLVSNIGGALTPLGDPPLFLGYLQGVSFFWPLKHLLVPTMLLAVLLLTTFFIVDRALYRREDRTRYPLSGTPFFVQGGAMNVPLLGLLSAAVAISGSVSVAGGLHVLGVEIPWTGLARDTALIGLAAVSLRFSGETRKLNGFEWAPVVEVAKLFAAIFITIVPAIAILRAGMHGAFAPLLSLLGGNGAPRPAAYFWLTGGLSGFLDNAPTYLVFFNAAGGDANRLMGEGARILAAISAGAVFMGANTYVGNAPNFMVKAIAERQGIRMPSFFAYMAWAAVFLLPCFAFVTAVFFR